jgi:hypothetical protein
MKSLRAHHHRARPAALRNVDDPTRRRTHQHGDSIITRRNSHDHVEGHDAKLAGIVEKMK